MAKNSQSFRIGNSYVNLAVGIIVVIAVAALVVGLIRNGKIQTPGENQEETQNMQEATLPAKHTVAQGEDLWKISEKYYKTGYNWVDIAKENNLSDPNAIETGMELTIPDVAIRNQGTEEVAQAIPSPVATQAAPATQGPQATEAPKATVTSAMEQKPAESQAPTQDVGAISGNSYTVVKGDDLWDIAVRAYGDGYKWVEIARANKLVNPDVIHPGNVFTLPR